MIYVSEKSNYAVIEVCKRTKKGATAPSDISNRLIRLLMPVMLRFLTVKVGCSHTCYSRMPVPGGQQRSQAAATED